MAVPVFCLCLSILFSVFTCFLLVPQVFFSASLKIINASLRRNNFWVCGDLFLISETDRPGLHDGLNNLSTLIIITYLYAILISIKKALQKAKTPV